MKLIDQTGTMYIAHFAYGRLDNGKPINTFCRLHVGPCPTETERPAFRCNRTDGEGDAVCSEKDEFKKLTGRKIALARAMINLGLGRPHRTQLWASYLKQITLS